MTAFNMNTPPATPAVPRAGVLTYWYQDSSLKYSGELYHLPRSGEVVSFNGSSYQIVEVTWVLNPDPAYVKWVIFTIVLISVSPEQAAEGIVPDKLIPNVQ